MIEFKDAIKKAKSNLKDIQSFAEEINVEQAILNDETKQYEITLSYKISGKDHLNDEIKSPALEALYAMSSFGRTYKTFLINKIDGSFKGFKVFKEN